LIENATPRRSYGRHPIVKTVSQVQLRLQRPGDDPFKTVQHEILEWVRRKAGKPLPKAAWDGLSFELDEVGAQRVTAAHLEVPRYWSARADDADRYVAQRTWITEIGLASAADGSVVFGCRLVVSARGDNPVYQPSIPVFVRDVVSGGNPLRWAGTPVVANRPVERTQPSSSPTRRRGRGRWLRRFGVDTRHGPKSRPNFHRQEYPDRGV
jgi:hypothetical protein